MSNLPDWTVRRGDEADHSAVLAVARQLSEHARTQQEDPEWPDRLTLSRAIRRD